MKVKVKVEKGGYMPERANFDDAGIDFRTPEEFTLGPAGSDTDQRVVDLRVRPEIPDWHYGKMESKSGLMVNHGVCCMGGVVNHGFRGTVKVRMINYSHTPYHFDQGDKVARMVIHPVLLATPETADELGRSESGHDVSGWGSTGK